MMLPCRLYLRLTISVALLHSSVFKVRVGKMSLNFVNSCTVTEEFEGRFSHILLERGSFVSCFNGLLCAV